MERHGIIAMETTTKCRVVLLIGGMRWQVEVRRREEAISVWRMHSLGRPTSHDKAARGVGIYIDQSLIVKRLMCILVHRVSKIVMTPTSLQEDASAHAARLQRLSPQLVFLLLQLGILKDLPIVLSCAVVACLSDCLPSIV